MTVRKGASADARSGRRRWTGSSGCGVQTILELRHAPDLRTLQAPDPVNPAARQSVEFDSARHLEAWC